MAETRAIIYSGEAPALENALHREFADRRINASTMRKEFFCIALEVVENAVNRLEPDCYSFKDRESQEWQARGAQGPVVEDRPQVRRGRR
ncbi:GIY-YIG nuclease family protein [Roseivivax marinus]|uniref:GIY-YIG nuclease family protein n=1 Tax=Roseivivax marinus TaxID=1379903 RepID=UPI00273F5776|nr:GIY-YIG nuclease family protein [Roseivivax marinus]